VLEGREGSKDCGLKDYRILGRVVERDEKGAFC
jgi:hypothetical protein